MLPNQETASIGMEYFCQKDDDLWEMSDANCGPGGARAREAGTRQGRRVVDGAVIRQPKAYPVYDGEYKEALEVLRGWIETLENFQTVGRNGLHRYNNQDHSMLSAMFAARNILGEHNNLWDVNVERSYHEEFTVEQKTGGDGQKDGQQAEQPIETRKMERARAVG